ncbi:ABC transporter transmembrane region-domain-containing protein [Mycena amicta]|nr:ABC transporter transmembrane region-domain-containing protein [Mycena amicta]
MQWALWPLQSEQLALIPIILSVVAILLGSKRELSSMSSYPRYFHLLRLAGCSTLWLLSGAQLANNFWDGFQLTLFTYHASFPSYAAILSVYLSCHKGHKLVTRHLTVIMALLCGFYAFRDIWPLATSNGVPKDLREGALLWFKIALVASMSVVLPLIIPMTTRDSTTLEESASIISHLTYSFLDPLIWLAYQSSHIELPRLSESNLASNLTVKSLLLLESHSGDLLWGMSIVFPSTSIRPGFWIVWILAASIFRTITSERYMYITTRTMVRMEAILQQLIIKHSLRIRTNFESPINKGTMGQLMNLTSDLANITAVMEAWLVLAIAPLQIALSIWFLYAILGWSALVGLGIMLMCLPMPAYLTVWVMHNIQTMRMKQTDERLQNVTETLSILQMIKIFGWESRIKERMSEKRSAELKVIRKDKLLSLLIGNFNFAIPFLTTIATYATYTLMMKQTLSASTVFSSMNVFELLRVELRCRIRNVLGMAKENFRSYYSKIHVLNPRLSLVIPSDPIIDLIKLLVQSIIAYYVLKYLFKVYAPTSYEETKSTDLVNPR